jgi:hypothetical protein
MNGPMPGCFDQRPAAASQWISTSVAQLLTNIAVRDLWGNWSICCWSTGPMIYRIFAAND